MRFIEIIGATLLSLMLLSQTSMGAPNKVDPAPVEAGRVLAQHLCSTCHPVPTEAEFPPALIHPAPSFEAIANRPGTTRESLRRFLANTHGDIALFPAKMPDLKLTDSQKSAAVAYILSLKDRSTGRE